MLNKLKLNNSHLVINQLLLKLNKLEWSKPSPNKALQQKEEYILTIWHGNFLA